MLEEFNYEEWKYLQLDLNTERVVAERAVENSLEPGLGLRGLHLLGSLLCHRILIF